jgi:hypothetical protein
MRRMRKRININHKSITRKVLRGKSRHARGVGQDYARVRVHKHRANVVIWKERVQARERRARAQHAKLRRIQTCGLARKQHGDNGFVFMRVTRIFRQVLTNRSRHFGGGAIKLRIRGELPVRALPARWNINRNHVWMKRNIVREKISQQLHQMYLMNYYAK